MRISTCLLLLTAGVCGVAATEPLHTATIHSNGTGGTLNPFENRGGWVNPEDLAPMPQCIAQQNPSTWLDAMTKCTGRRCTRHFGVFCTHQQWLTQLSCLSMGFSSDVIEAYLPYCGRSVLAKAQLYLWVHKITGRTWLVDVGDANGLQYLSPTSLTEGYAAVDVIYKAPKCLTGSVSAISMEPFQHVMASCSFTSTTRHTGNAARPWEYSESLRSMIALDFETVGYNLTGGSIGYGDYFDRECFCSTFNIDPKMEPCSGPGQIDLTKERLWINATCGPTSLPDNWTDILKTTEFAYIPLKHWQWPVCVADISREVIKLTDQCATDACEVDSSGYCKVQRAVDRACFCRDISYDSCGGSCQIFETRIDYIKWLHDLCGNVQDWHGLPNNWRQLASPTPLEMIPWRWTLKPSNRSKITSISRLGSIGTTETCPSNEWKLRSFALVNIATLLAVFLSQRTCIRRIARGFPWHPHSWSWFFRGTLITTLQLLANWFNVFLVQKTPGYEDVPGTQLLLLWCSMPRLSWLTILLISVQPFEAINFSAAVSSLIAEMTLQFLSLYYMAMTVNYGREHNFYLGGMDKAERGGPAKIMYAGALIWLIIVSLALVHLMLAICRINRLTASGSLDLPKRQRGKQTTSNIAEELMAMWTERCTRLRDKLVYYGMDRSRDSEERLLAISDGGDYRVYGTFPVEGQNNWVSRKASVELYAATVISMLLLWITQWLFWSGFIGLSSEEFCPPKLGVLTAVWIASSIAGVAIGAT